MAESLPLGKLPIELLGRLLEQGNIQDPHVIVGPGIGLDCAVVEIGDRLLVLKSDPITFTTDRIGWYAVQVNANDLATMGAKPRWLLITMLLPENRTSPELALDIAGEIQRACTFLGITVIGGHTEVTYGLDRPILVGTLIGEVAPENLITPRGAEIGDQILLTKSVPIEATAILAQEFPDRLRGKLSGDEIHEARSYLDQPGISVVLDAEVATGAGRVTAMHDPTEGGVAAALWELAIASDRALFVNPDAIPVTPLSKRICQIFELDPLGAIASGALLLTSPRNHVQKICAALKTSAIPCSVIGEVVAGPPVVWIGSDPGVIQLPRPTRDEITRLFEIPGDP